MKKIKKKVVVVLAVESIDGFIMSYTLTLTYIWISARILEVEKALDGSLLDRCPRSATPLVPHF